MRQIQHFLIFWSITLLFNHLFKIGRALFTSIFFFTFILHLFHLHTKHTHKTKGCKKASKTLSKWQLYGRHRKGCQGRHHIQPKYCHYDNNSWVVMFWQPLDNFDILRWQPLLLGLPKQAPSNCNHKVFKLTTHELLYLTTFWRPLADNLAPWGCQNRHRQIPTLKLSNWQLFDYLSTTLCFVCTVQ